LRSIHTPQELLLLHKIADTLGKSEQGLEYLRDPNLGPESVVARGEWQLWRIRLTLLKTAHQWKELFGVTKALLERARTKDGAGQLSKANFSDWIVWDAFVCASTEIGGDE
jgi:N-terminal acetyltransferase B complex non-catalytic subunit